MLSFSPISAAPISGTTGGDYSALVVPSPLGAPAVVAEQPTVYTIVSCPGPIAAPAIIDVPLAVGNVSAPGPMAAPAVVALSTPVLLVSIPGPLKTPEVWAVRPPAAICSTPGPLSAPAVGAWHDWSVSITVGRRTNIYVLEIEATGFDTVRIPISNYQSRLRSGDPSYLQVSIPDAPTWAAAVAERAGGQMILYGGIRIEETGAELLEEIARVDIGLIADQRGVRNQTLSVSGHATLSPGAARTRTLRGLSYRASSGTGKRYRCSPDVFLRPGDTAVVSEYGESITVGLIVHVVGGRHSTMEVSEAAA
jgi:hypothetical protein